MESFIDDLAKFCCAIANYLLFRTETVQQAMPKFNFEIFLQFPQFLRFKSSIVRQLVRQLMHLISGDKNLAPFTFCGEWKLS